MHIQVVDSQDNTECTIKILRVRDGVPTVMGNEGNIKYYQRLTANPDYSKGRKPIKFLSKFDETWGFFTALHLDKYIPSEYNTYSYANFLIKNTPQTWYLNIRLRVPQYDNQAEYLKNQINWEVYYSHNKITKDSEWKNVTQLISGLQGAPILANKMPDRHTGHDYILLQDLNQQGKNNRYNGMVGTPAIKFISTNGSSFYETSHEYIYDQNYRNYLYTPSYLFVGFGNVNKDAGVVIPLDVPCWGLVQPWKEFSQAYYAQLNTLHFTNYSYDFETKFIDALGEEAVKPDKGDEYPDSDSGGDGDKDSEGEGDGTTLPDGDHDDDSDDVDYPDLPSIGAYTTGMFGLYRMTAEELQSLAKFMWSGDFINLLKKLLTDPMDVILSLRMFYCNVQAGDVTEIILGNVVAPEVYGRRIKNQYVEVNMGQLIINHYWGNAIDYEPYTKFKIFLPYIGYKDLATNEIMNSTVELSYRIDLFTGDCVALIKITKDIGDTKLNSVLYQFTGHAGSDIPFSANNMASMLSDTIQGMAAMALAAKGGSARLASSAVNSAMNVMGDAGNYEHGGSATAGTNNLTIRQPYIIIERPILQIPQKFTAYKGLPYNYYTRLDDISGYTEVEEIQFVSGTCTDSEKKAIVQLLKDGVIL